MHFSSVFASRTSSAVKGLLLTLMLAGCAAVAPAPSQPAACSKSPNQRDVNVEVQRLLSRGQVAAVQLVQAEQANMPFVAKGFYPPYDADCPVRAFTTVTELRLSRVSTPSNHIGAFLAEPTEIAGMKAADIQQLLALPKVPSHKAEVTVPPGTPVQLGIVAAQSEYQAPGGGLQYQLLSLIPLSGFATPGLIE